MMTPRSLHVDERLGLEFRKVRIHVELMEQLMAAALSRGHRIEWGEPDAEGFYTPTVYLAEMGPVPVPGWDQAEVEARALASQPVDHLEGKE